MIQLFVLTVVKSHWYNKDVSDIMAMEFALDSVQTVMTPTTLLVGVYLFYLT